MPSTRLSHLRYAAYGLVATLVGMTAAHLTAALLSPDSSPVLAVGSTVIDLTPAPVKSWAIATFGNADKPILIGSVLAGTLVLAALAGILARRRFALGAGLIVFLVALAGAAAVLRPAAGAADVLPSVVAGLVGVGVLFGLHRLDRGRATARPAGSRLGTGAREEDGETPGPGRRPVLVAAGLVAVAAGLGSAGQWLISRASRPEDVALPSATDAAGTFPKGLESRIPGISTLRTSNDEFYRVDTALVIPTISADDWTLTIDGDVENELEFSFEDLLAMPLIERDITMTCVSNPVGGEYVGAARWLGVRLTDLLDQAGVGSGADQILSTADDGFTISTPLAVATDGRDAMVAIGMNGEALPREHGFPARLITPGIYGFVGATKWLTKLTLTTYAEQEAYWTERDWATDAPIKISSRIDTPRALAQLKPGNNVIAGVAWAQTRGIDRVEVRVDGGPWQPAKLGPEVTIDYWRQWYYEWDAQPGSHSIATRAIGKDGEVQTAAKAGDFPDGYSGIDEYLVTVA